MKSVLMFFLSQLMILSFAQAMDEADIPPPPMPDYMKKAGYVPMKKRQIASEEPIAEQFQEQSEESIKQEFLQAGEDEIVDEPLPEVDPVISEVPLEELEDEISEPESQQVVLETPKVPPTVVEDQEIEEQVAEQEFQQVDANAQEELPAAKEIAQEAKPQTQELAEVEETLEQAEQQAEANLERPRQPSSKKPFKSGMYKFAKECKMYSEPSSISDTAGKVRAGRKLWIDPHEEGWHKAYKKSGTVYISADCLEAKN